MALFGKKEVYTAEADRARSDWGKIIKIRSVAQNKNDPKQMQSWFRSMIMVLEDETYHPVARLGFSDRYDVTVGDFLRKLKQASGNDGVAIAEVESIKAKTPNLIKDELDYLRSEEARWSKIAEDVRESAEQKFVYLKSNISKDLARERELYEAAFPKDKEDMMQWKSYYQQRISRLELQALSPAVRLIWVTSMPKDKIDGLISKYVDLLNSSNEPGVEEEFHKLEAEIDCIVKAEAVRLRKDYGHFLMSSAA